MEEKKFRFWMPIDKIEKAKDEAGNDVMIVGGLASTSRNDLDGETLNPTPEGFDVSYLRERGVVNWNHSKQPDAIIGEPSKIEFRKGGMYVESMLYPDSELAKKVYALGKNFQKHSKTRRLGYSIEGAALVRDLANPSFVPKARITGLALTVNPKNADSVVDILKGEFHEFIDDDAIMAAEILDISNVANGGTNHLLDITKPDGTRIILDRSYNLKIYKDLSANGNGAPLKKESLKQEIVELPAITSKKDTRLTKAQCFEKIFDRCGVITLEKANNIFETLNSLNMEINTTGKLTEVTDDMLEKALGILNSTESKAVSILEKGAKEEAPKKKKKKEEDEDDEEGEEKKDTGHYEKMEKALIANANSMQENFGALGTLFKGLRDRVNEGNELVKGLQTENNTLKTTVDALKKSVDEIGDTGQGRRSATSAKAIERNFVKSIDGEEGQGGTANDMLEKAITEGKAIKVGNKRAVSNLLDTMVFEKGFRPELAKALTTFEATGQVGQDVVEIVKKEKGILIVR